MKHAFPKFSRREFIRRGSTALAGFGLAAGLPSVAGAVQSTSVKVGVLAPSHCALPMVYSSLRGFYKEHGLRVEVHYATTMPEIAKGLVQGEIHFGQLMVPLTWAAHVGAGPFKEKHRPLVSPMWAGTNGGAMVVRKDSDIRLPQDLKGKTIGIHSKLLFHYLITVELLARHKLAVDKEVSIKTIHMKDMVTALKEGEIDAFINAEPLSSAAVAKGVGRDFLLTKDLWYGHPCCCLAAPRSLFDNEPELFRDFVSATMRGSLDLNATADRNQKLEMVWEKSPQYRKTPLKVLQNAFLPGRTDFNPFPYQSSVKIVGRLLQKQGVLPQDHPIEKASAELFLSDYAREILHAIGAPKIPTANARPERVVGRVVS